MRITNIAYKKLFWIHLGKIKLIDKTLLQMSNDNHYQLGYDS